jgi:hypothetical protein
VREVQQRWAPHAPARWWKKPWPPSPSGLVERGVGQLVVAGGETSGAVVQALGVRQMRIGPQIDPGVPWCHAPARLRPTVHLALKSGNFGSADFFTKAFGARMNETQAREEICRVGRACSSAATCMPPPATSACGWTTAS